MKPPFGQRTAERVSKLTNMYTSLIKAKEGEFTALVKGGLPSATRILLERNSVEIGTRVMTRINEAVALCGPRDFAIDTTAVTGHQGPALRSFLSALPPEARSKILPVVSPLSGSRHRRFAVDQAAASGLLIARFPFSGRVSELEDDVAELLGDLELPPESVALILDFKDVHGADPNDLAQRFLAARLFTEEGFDSVTVAATSFPAGIASFPRRWSLHNRPELTAWRQVVESTGSEIGFGDYACRSSAFPPPGFANTLAQTRYTLEDHVLIYRGNLLRSDHNQHRIIATELTSTSNYMGGDFSWGDGEINKVASAERGVGNRSNWIGFETSHHWSLTSTQVSSTLGI